MSNTDTYDLTIYLKNDNFIVRFLEFHNISETEVDSYVKYYKSNGEPGFEFLSWECYNG